MEHICIFYIIIFRKSVFASKNLSKYSDHVSIFPHATFSNTSLGISRELFRLRTTKRHRCVQPIQQLVSCWIRIRTVRFFSLKKPPMEAYLTLLRQSNRKAVRTVSLLSPWKSKTARRDCPAVFSYRSPLLTLLGLLWQCRLHPGTFSGSSR